MSLLRKGLLLCAAFFLAAPAHAVPISSVPEPVLNQDVVANTPGIAPSKTELQSFIPAIRSSARRSSYAASIAASSRRTASDSGGYDPQISHFEVASIRFVSPEMFPTGTEGAAAQQTGPMESLNREVLNESPMNFEEDIPFLQLIKYFESTTGSFLTLERQSGISEDYVDAMGSDVLDSRRGVFNPSANYKLEGGTADVNLETLRLAVPNVQDHEGITARIVYFLALLADPYRILVNHPIAVFLGFCFLAFVLSLRRRA